MINKEVEHSSSSCYHTCAMRIHVLVLCKLQSTKNHFPYDLKEKSRETLSNLLFCLIIIICLVVFLSRCCITAVVFSCKLSKLSMALKSFHIFSRVITTSLSFMFNQVIKYLLTHSSKMIKCLDTADCSCLSAHGLGWLCPWNILSYFCQFNKSRISLA